MTSEDEQHLSRRLVAAASVTAVRLLGIAAVAAVAYGLVGGGVTAMEKEFDKAVIGLYQARFPATHPDSIRVTTQVPGAMTTGSVPPIAGDTNVAPQPRGSTP